MAKFCLTRKKAHEGVRRKSRPDAELQVFRRDKRLEYPQRQDSVHSHTKTQLLEMLSFVGYFALLYLLVGLFFYLWGHPQILPERKKAGGLQSKGVGDFPSRHTAHAVQAVAFIINGIPALKRKVPASLEELYRAAVKRAFHPRRSFITTGAPHSRAIYPRNYAWFYPCLLDPKSIVDSEDAEDRIELLVRGLSIILRNGKTLPFPTTFIPLTSRRFAAVNYVRQPSDSLLGVLAGIQTLVHAPLAEGTTLESAFARARQEGRRLLAENLPILRFQLESLMASLAQFTFGGVTTLLIDRDESRSSATDTRIERRRFVTNANVWATLVKADRLGLLSRVEIEGRIGRSLDEFKRELLSMFGHEGYIVDSLDVLTAFPARNVTLDFCHVFDGFWSFESDQEMSIFRNTADLFLKSETLQDDSRHCFLIAADNPNVSFFNRIGAASYHGRSMWPTFNVEFADRLIDLHAQQGNIGEHHVAARRILTQLRAYIETLGFYPEILRASGQPYRTWIYRCARADSWFPRLVSVEARLDRIGMRGAG